jgi:hypothetical protein
MLLGHRRRAKGANGVLARGSLVRARSNDRTALGALAEIIHNCVGHATALMFRPGHRLHSDQALERARTASAGMATRWPADRRLSHSRFSAWPAAPVKTGHCGPTG